VTVARTAFAASWLLRRRVPGAGPGRATGRPPPHGDRRRFLSLVVRLPAGIAERLAWAAASLGAIQPEHYFYPSADIHLTVVGLADRPGVAERVGAAIAHRPPFELEVGGLNASAETVFAELYPLGPALRALRGELRLAESREHGLASRWLRRRLAHANVVRFAAPVDARLLAAVGRLRRARFGRFEVGEMELVHGDRVLSAPATRTLGRFRLGGR
jgi:2'-5' RNA ligase